MAIAYKSTGALVRAVRAAKTNPNIRFHVPGDFPLTADEVLFSTTRGSSTITPGVFVGRAAICCATPK